jgi:hypothetical protein
MSSPFSLPAETFASTGCWRMTRWQSSLSREIVSHKVYHLKEEWSLPTFATPGSGLLSHPRTRAWVARGFESWNRCY